MARQLESDLGWLPALVPVLRNQERSDSCAATNLGIVMVVQAECVIYTSREVVS